MGARAAIAGSAMILIAGFLWLHGEQSIGHLQAPQEAQRSLQARYEDAIRRNNPVHSNPLVLFNSSLANTSSLPGGAMRGTVYVPAYSSIRIASGRSRIDLATTLSIHNTSKDKGLILERVDYHETNGNLVHRYLEKPIVLKPFGAIEIFVPSDDGQGGGGANFVVYWSAVEPITNPLIEAVMIGSNGTASHSFVSQGRMLEMSSSLSRL